jgi:4-nitrophenyl phosphatase
MIGDRLDTDIAFGKGGGLSTLLVMTGASDYLMFSMHIKCNIYDYSHNCGLSPGVTTPKILSESTITPDYITNSLGDLRILI